MTICWFGIYNPDFSRNKIYIKGLKEEGVSIIECQDTTKGPLKYIKLFLKHWKIRGDYDYLWVGYPGHPVVWLAKIISRKPVIFDALCTMEEGVLVSRKQASNFSLRALYIKFIDWLGVMCADKVLVETEAQREFFIKKFGINKAKCFVVYIGASPAFHQDLKIPKNERFTVLFRGQFLPEAGARYVVDSAKILENEDIDFLLVGNGFLLKEIEEHVKNINPKNLQFITKSFSQDELRELMLPCHVSLGQLENHDRLNRTIPHKCFESMAMGITYIHANFPPVAEILKDGESVIFVNPADPKDLSNKILYLKNNIDICRKIGDEGLRIFEKNFTPQALASKIKTYLMQKQ